MAAVENTVSLQNVCIVPGYVNRGLSLVEGEGVFLIDEAGRRYLDLMSSYGVACFGYRHPVIEKFLGRQLGRIPCLHGSFANDSRVEAAQALMARCGGGLARAAFCNSGSEAIEAALKFAVLATGRKKFIACRGGYHGKTLGALSATDGARYRKSFDPLLWDFRFIPYNDADALSAALDGDTAAVIVEPIQGESGIHVASEHYLRSAAGLCRKAEALLILDEIQTGAGRTGDFLASHAYGITGDIVTLGKGLAGGIPIGATLVSERVAEAVPRGAHTSTFGGNPLAAAGISATLGLLDDACLEHIREIGSYFAASLRQIAAPVIREIRGKGLMIGMEVVHSRDAVLKALQRERVLAIPAGENVVRFLPPYILQRNHVDLLLEKLTLILRSSPFADHESCAGF
jgi:acetylornithine/LysW-gamma-L-lysine aminotransferase